jgi:hypothetical protein
VARVDEGQRQAEIDRPALRGRDVGSSPGGIAPTDPAEAALERRAKRQGLGLMVVSSIASILVLYGAWVLLRL